MPAPISPQLQGNVAITGGIATSATSTTLTDSKQSWTTNQWTNFYCQIVAGTGVGEWLGIASNTATVLTLSGTWAQNPDTTSQYAIFATLPGISSVLGQGALIQGPPFGITSSPDYTIYANGSTYYAQLSPESALAAVASSTSLATVAEKCVSNGATRIAFKGTFQGLTWVVTNGNVQTANGLNPAVNNQPLLIESDGCLVLQPPLLNSQVLAIPSGVTLYNCSVQDNNFSSVGLPTNTPRFSTLITNTGDATYSVVSSTSASGQAVLNVADTTGFIATQQVVVNSNNQGSATKETLTIQSISAGTPGTLTMTGNLVNQHLIGESVQQQGGPGTALNPINRVGDGWVFNNGLTATGTAGSADSRALAFTGFGAGDIVYVSPRLMGIGGVGIRVENGDSAQHYSELNTTGILGLNYNAGTLMKLFSKVGSTGAQTLLIVPETDTISLKIDSTNGTDAASVATTSDLVITTTKKTGGQMINLFQNTSAFAGDAIIANFASGSGTHTGTFFKAQKNTVNQFVINNVGKLSTYNAIATAGVGVQPVLAAGAQTLYTNAAPTLLTYTPPATAGVYRLHGFLNVLTGGTLTFRVKITYHDAGGNAITDVPVFTQQNSATLLVGGPTANTTGRFNFSWDFSVDNSATAITIQDNTGTYTAGTYYWDPILEQLA